MPYDRLTSAAASPRRLLSLASPLFAELALGIGAGLIGTALAAGISDAAAAAFALANHVAAMLFILFDIEVVFLYPVGAILKSTDSVFVLAEVILFVALLFVALIYVWRKGALDWR